MTVIKSNESVVKMAHGYQSSPMYRAAKEITNLFTNIMQEQQINVGKNFDSALLLEESNNALKNYFVNESIDPQEFKALNMPEAIEEEMEMMEAQYENDRKAILEYASMGSFNPVIGLTFPMHKNILMNCIFDKGGVQKAVTTVPKFTVTMENRYLVKPNGEKVDLYKNQLNITKAFRSTNPYVEVTLDPITIAPTVDVVTQIGGSSLDHLSIDCTISQIKVETFYEKDAVKPDGETVTNPEGETVDLWIPCDVRFVPNYNNERNATKTFDFTAYPALKGSIKTDTIYATMSGDKFTIASATGVVKGVKIKARKDASNGLLNTCTVKWDTTTSFVEIPDATPINVPVSPEELKDINALYNVNQVSKNMEMINDVLTNVKDDDIRDFLLESFKKLDPSQKVEGSFDFAPPSGYALDHVEYRRQTFMDALDSYVTSLLQVLNDPNMTITVYGRPDIIRKITPKDFIYSTPSSIGPVELEFTKTIVNASDKRVYQFMSSQKLNDTNKLIIILQPRNTNRIIYRVYDYQFYISNEIRNAQLMTLPSMHAFNRYKIMEYQPVQGQVEILNPSGLRGGTI